MLFTQSLRKYGDRVAGFLRHSGSGRSLDPHVLVVEHSTRNGWKAVEAEVDRESITVLGTYVLDDEAANRGPQWLRHGNNARVALIPDSQKSVCRMLEMAKASPDQVERMVALRLELELPFPVAESTWICEPQANGVGAVSRALLIATSTRTISDAEVQLRNWGIRGADIEFAPAGLAELGLACNPSSDTVAVLRVERDSALLVMTHARALSYARHIRLALTDDGSTNPEMTWVPRLAKEVKQSIYDYQLRTGNDAPERLFISGWRMGESDLLTSLAAPLEMPVCELRPPLTVRVVKPGSTEESLLAEFPIALGVLVAIQRRAQGERSAAPTFRRRRSRALAIDWKARGGTLVALNVLFLFLLLVSLFAIPSVQVSSADRLMQDSRPLLRRLEGLQEEVDILQYESKRQTSQLDVIRALAEALPSDVTVETFTVDSKGKVTIGGKAKSVELASDTVVAALEASNAFANPQFRGATREKEAFGFQITCELRAGGLRNP